MKSSDYKSFSGFGSKSTRNVKPKTFKQAFSDARKAGKKTFSFDGKRFTTQTKDDVKSARKSMKMGSSKNIDPKTLKGSGRPRKTVLGSARNIGASKGDGSVYGGRTRKVSPRVGKNISGKSIVGARVSRAKEGTQGGASAPDFNARFKALSKKVAVKNPDMKDVNEFARMGKILLKNMKKGGVIGGVKRKRR
tara:strand:- start:433 stop:1011 length:579 start_codon:yes stop_codon:yes gene_type:complete